MDFFVNKICTVSVYKYVFSWKFYTVKNNIRLRRGTIKISFILVNRLNRVY